MLEDYEEDLKPLLSANYNDESKEKYKKKKWYQCPCLGRTSYDRTMRSSSICIAILLLLSVIVPLVLTEFKNMGIKESVVIDSYDSPNYDTWQSNFYGPGDKREVLLNVHFFSIQNPVRALLGDKPIMLEQGPYVFQQYFNRFDVKYLDNGNIVQYRYQTFFIFNPEKSGPGLSLKDKFILPYPSALGFQFLLQQIPVTAETLLDAAVEGAINSKLDAVTNALVVRKNQINKNPLLTPEEKAEKTAEIDRLLGLVATIESGVDGYIEDAPAGSSLLKLLMCTALPNTTGVSMFWEIGPVDAYFGFLNDPLKSEVQVLLDALNLTDKVPWDTSIPGSMTNYTSEYDATRRRNIVQQKTGKDNLKNNGQYLLWNNQSTQYVCVAPMDSQNESTYIEGEEFPWCDPLQAEWNATTAYEKGYVLVYAGDYANRVEGTDGVIFGAPVDSEKLQAYTDAVYRSSFIKYDTMVHDWHGVALRRYVVNMKDSENATTNPEGKQFYNFAPNGLGNLTQVATLPLFISKPHFLDADSVYVSSLKGMQPNRDIHDTYIDVEPNTGVAFRLMNRCQTNYQLNSYHLPKVTPETLVAVEGLCVALQNDTLSNATCNGVDVLMQCLAVPTDWKVFNDQVYVPYAWTEQTTQGSEEDANSIKDGIYFVDNLSYYFQIACYSISGLLLVFLLGVNYERSRNSNRKDDESERNVF